MQSGAFGFAASLRHVLFQLIVLLPVDDGAQEVDDGNLGQKTIHTQSADVDLDVDVARC